jgi:hypothetical protein
MSGRAGTLQCAAALCNRNRRCDSHGGWVYATMHYGRVRLCGTHSRSLERRQWVSLWVDGISARVLPRREAKIVLATTPPPRRAR